MLRTMAILMLVTPSVGLAQEAQVIAMGQTLSGELGPDDWSYEGRAYDDYDYSAVPGAEVLVVVRSSEMAVDVNVYFYDEYFDLLPLVAGGAAPKDSVEFTEPDAGSDVVIMIRVSTMAGASGPTTGDYTIELSSREDPWAVATSPSRGALPPLLKPDIEQSLPQRSPLTHAASIFDSGSSIESHLRGPLCVYDPPHGAGELPVPRALDHLLDARRPGVIRPDGRGTTNAPELRVPRGPRRVPGLFQLSPIQRNTVSTVI